MTIIKTISDILKRGKVQRVCYLLGLAFWLFLNENQFHKYDKESSYFGITYLWVISIPATLLFLQILLNNWFLWLTIFVSVLTFSLYSAFYTLTDNIDRSGNHVKAIYWDFETTAILITIYIVIILTNWTIYKIRPRRRRTLPVT